MTVWDLPYSAVCGEEVTFKVGAKCGAGCTLDDVVRVRYYLAEVALFDRLAPVFGQYFARARPAATAIVCGLVDPRMKLEIEVTARRS
jgi:enamine deaminase RidA (YjgF/YER057c/UK114 family)